MTGSGSCSGVAGGASLAARPQAAAKWGSRGSPRELMAIAEPRMGQAQRRAAARAFAELRVGPVLPMGCRGLGRIGGLWLSHWEQALAGRPRSQTLTRRFRCWVADHQAYGSGLRGISDADLSFDLRPAVSLVGIDMK